MDFLYENLLKSKLKNEDIESKSNYRKCIK